MTRTSTISKYPLLLLLAGLIAVAVIGFGANRADAAATSGTVTATCYSDGYIIVNDGGNVASAPKYLQLQIAHRISGGWRWTTYAWRSVNGSSFRLNATKGADYWIYATVATQTASGFSYVKGYVPVENVKVSPIGAITVDSRTLGYCKT